MTLSAAIALALGAVVLATTSLPARAGSDDDSGPADSKFLRGILEGIGLRRGDEGPGINYQERAPLVIPANHDLPPPQSGNAAIANNPNWPKDPDVERAKQAAKASHIDRRALFEAEENPLRPSQLAPGSRIPGGPRVSSNVDGTTTHMIGGPVSPSELGYKGGIFNFFHRDDEYAHFTGEPPRASLTDPPPGYQTPSPDQPYGVSNSYERYHPKAYDYATQHGTVTSGE